MSISTAIATFFLIWWIILFVVLPWGVHPQGGENAPSGTDPGAPVTPRLVSKAIWTTVMTAIVWGIFAAIYSSGVINLDDLYKMLGLGSFR